MLTPHTYRPDPNKPGAEIAHANMAIREALSQLGGVDTRRVEFMDSLARGQEGGPTTKEPLRVYAWQQETVAALFEAVVRQQERIERLESAVERLEGVVEELGGEDLSEGP